MNPPDERELERHATREPREINYYLRQLVHDGEAITARFGENDSLLTVLLDVDEDNGLLYFDWGGAESVNARLLHSPRCVFVCNPQGIRHQFALGKVWKASYDRRPAFAARLPTQFIRLQRREFFRLPLPLAQRMSCQIGIGFDRLRLPIVDLGIGGIGVEGPALPTDLAAGSHYANAWFDLPQAQRIAVELELRYTTPVQHADKRLIRLGFAFCALQSSDELAVQRFLMHVQHELKARIG